MRRILILYGSTHGQTAKVAARMAETLRRRSLAVDVIEAGTKACWPDGYDGIIVAASVHAGGYQKPVRRWVASCAGALNRKPTAFVSVCLGILQKDPKVQKELAAIAERFTAKSGWKPGVVKPVAGALQYTRYNWFLRRMMKRIVQKAGGDTDTTRDYEYTDWNDLRAFAEEFAGRVAAKERAGPVALGA
jgi:menaquinone-dependent protoporphyrinogen oxidase